MIVANTLVHAQTHTKPQVCGLDYAVYLRFVQLLPHSPYFIRPGSPDWLLPEGLLCEWDALEEAPDYLCEADRLADLLFIAVALHFYDGTWYLERVMQRAKVLRDRGEIHAGEWLIVALARAKQRVQGQIGFWTYGDARLIVQMGAVTWQEMMVVPPVCA